MNLNLLSILSRAPQAISGKPEDGHADALAAVPLSSAFSDQLGQQLAARNSQDIKAELMVAQGVALAQPSATVEAPVDVAGVLVLAPDTPVDPLVLPVAVGDDVYLNVSTDEVLAHTAKLAIQSLTDDRNITMQLGADGQVITHVVAVDESAKPLQVDDLPVDVAPAINVTLVAVADVAQDNPAVAALTQLLPQSNDAIPEEDTAVAPDDKELAIDENTVVIPFVNALPSEQAVTTLAVPVTVAVAATRVNVPAMDADGDEPLDTQKPSVKQGENVNKDSVNAPMNRKEMEAVVQRVLANRVDAQAATKTESFADVLAASNKGVSAAAFDATKDGVDGTLSSPDAAPVSASGAIGSSVGLSVAGQERASNILTLKASTFAASDKATPADQVKVGIRQAIRAGVDRVSITMEPEELGRVEVKIDIHKNGANHIVFTADNRFALEAIQRDVKQLEQALHNSGLGSDANTMEFNLNQRRESQDEQPRGSEYGRVDDVRDGAQNETIAPMTAYYNVTVSEGLDIKV